MDRRLRSVTVVRRINWVHRPSFTASTSPQPINRLPRRREQNAEDTELKTNSSLSGSRKRWIKLDFHPDAGRRTFLVPVFSV